MSCPCRATCLGVPRDRAARRSETAPPTARAGACAARSRWGGRRRWRARIATAPRRCPTSTNSPRRSTRHCLPHAQTIVRSSRACRGARSARTRAGSRGVGGSRRRRRRRTVLRSRRPRRLLRRHSAARAPAAQQPTRCLVVQALAGAAFCSSDCLYSFIFAHELLSSKVPDAALHFFRRADVLKAAESSRGLAGSSEQISRVTSPYSRRSSPRSASPPPQRAHFSVDSEEDASGLPAPLPMHGGPPPPHTVRRPLPS